MLKLIIEDDEKQVKVVRLLRDEVTIGRKEGNTIRLTERNVSRRHARLIQRPEGILLEDLGSYNGVKVNGDRITEPLPIAEGDKIVIGDYTLMLKLDEQEGAVDPFEEMATVPVERVDLESVTGVAAPAPAAAALPVAAATSIPSQPAVASVPAIPAVSEPAFTAEQGTQLIPAAEVAQLVLLTSNQAGTFYSIDRTPMIIGRTSENDIVIDHKSISRNHAKISFANGIYSVTDMQSANGVRINGEPYDNMSLRKGDTLDLGHVRLRFVAPGEKFDYVAESYGESGDRSNKGIIIIALVLVVAVGIGFVAFGSKLFGGKGDDVAATKPQGASLEQVTSRLEELKKNRQWREAIMLVDETVNKGELPQADRDRLAAEKPELQKNLEHDAAIKQVVGVQIPKGQWTAAYQAMLSIPQGALYYDEAQKQVGVIRTSFLQSAVAQAKQDVLSKNCPDIDALIKTANELALPTDQQLELVEHQKACAAGGPAVAMNPDPPADMPPDMPADMPPDMTPTKPSNEEAEAWLNQAWAAKDSDCSKAVKLAQKAYAVTHNNKAVLVVGLCGCKEKNTGWAKWAYSRIASGQKKTIQGLCSKNGIELN